MQEKSYSKKSYSDNTLEEESISLLEWDSLKMHLSSFASTEMGKRAILSFGIPSDYEASRILLNETVEINELENNDYIKPEIYFNKETRFDFLIEKKKQKSFIEVKNVTLFREKKTAEFPDAITTRGSKHLLTLIDAIKKGYKSYLIFLVQIQNMENFKIAKDIDEEYYKNYLSAKKAGVNFLAYRCKINSKEIIIEKKIKIING